MRVQLPKLIFGATTLGNLFVAPTDEQKRELIRQWFLQGESPVLIDSAGKYGAGLSLEVIGRELATLGIEPSQVVISNKLAWRRVPLKTPEPTFEPGAWIGLGHDAVQDISREGILRCWREGNELLRPYRAGLLSVHDPDEYLAAAVDADDRRRRLDDILQAYAAIRELRDAGETTGIGVGAKDWRVIQELAPHCDFDWVMFANSFTIMRHPQELIDFIESLAARGVWVINSALMHGGFLTGGSFCDYRELDPTRPADADKLRWRQAFLEACRELSVDPFHVAVRFGMGLPGIRSVALSTSQPHRVGALVDAVQDPVSPAVWEELLRRGLTRIVPVA